MATRYSLLSSDNRSARIRQDVDTLARQRTEYLKTCPYVTSVSTTLPEDLEHTPSRSPFHLLQRIPLNSLRLDQVAKGCYVVLKVVAPPVAMTSVVLACEDSKGEVERVAVYNHPLFEGMRSGTEAPKLLPPGSILAIKEPRFKIARDGDYVLRIDFPSSCAFLPPSLSLQQAEADLQAKTLDTGRCEFYNTQGAFLYEANVLARALDCFAMATKFPQCPWPVFSNSSIVQMKLGRPYEAFCDAIAAVRGSGGAPASLKRAADAAIECRFFRVAEEYQRRYLHAVGKDEDSDDVILALRRCVREMFTGEYGDLKKIFLYGSSKEGATRLIGDFVGPLRIVNVPGKGRGVVATRSVREGELLFCCKELLRVEVSDDTRVPQRNITRYRAYETGACDELRKRAIMAVSSDRLFQYWFSLLDCGCDRQRDLVSFEDIRDIELGGVPEEWALTPLQVSNIVTRNLSGGGESTVASIFLHTSFFNHSCVPNTCGDATGGVLTVLASEDIAEGEEVTATYASFGLPYEERKRLLAEMGVTCDCSLCRKERR